MSRSPDPRGPRIWDRPENVRRLIWTFAVACVLVFLLDAVVHRHSPFAHGVAAFEQWFGFYAFYGFVACVLLVLVAKQLRRVVMRDEDYWNEREREEDPPGLLIVEPPAGGHDHDRSEDADG